MAYENISVKIIALELLFRTKFTMITKLGWIYKDQIVTYAIKKMVSMLRTPHNLFTTL